MENTTLNASLENANHSGYTVYYDKNKSITQNNLQSSDQISKKYIDMSIMVVYSMLCLLGIIGNAFVIWFGIFGMKKTVNVLWFLNLAAADFSFAFFFLLNSTQELVTSWLFVKGMCMLSNLFLYINMVVSVLQITVISVDRCICVMFPVWCHNQWRPRLAFLIVLIIWIIPFAVAIPNVINIDTSYIHNRTMCIETIDNSSLIKRTILECIFLFLVPFIVIVSSSILTVLHVRRRHMESSRPLKTTLAVITAFFFCWFPTHLFFLLVTLKGNTFHINVIYYGIKMSNLLVVINSCIHPVLYVFIGRGLKDKFCGSFQARIRKAWMEEDQTERSTVLQISH